MPQMKTNDKYYTATQAEQVLGITHGMLYQYVRNGNLHPVIPPGKKQGVYPKKEVDRLATELQAFFATSKPEKDTTTIEQAKEEDLPEVVAISQRIFGTGPGVPSLKTRTTWLKKNPDTFYVLKHEGHVVGYTSLLPLTKEKVDKLITEEERGRDISYYDVLTFTPDIPIHLYIMAIGVDPRLPSRDKHIYGARLVSKLMRLLVDLGKRGIMIETITARSYKADGIRLLRKMGFPEIPSPVRDTRLFVINVKESGSPLIMRYKEALQETQEQEPQSTQQLNKQGVRTETSV